MRVLSFLLTWWVGAASATLTAAEVGLLVNRAEPASEQVAQHYLAARGVPPEQVLRLNLGTSETLPRETYRDEVAPAVRAWLAAPERAGLRCLLLIYGCPLRVGREAPSPQQQEQLAVVEPEYRAARDAARQASDRSQALRQARAERDLTAAEAEELADLARRLPELQQRERDRTGPYRRLARHETEAALDSELAMVRFESYDLYRWVPNLLNFTVPEAVRAANPAVLMTARLDGPTPETTMRLVDDAIHAERHPLTGTVYLDARGRRFDPAKPDYFGYAGYDEPLRELAELLRAETDLPVVLNDEDRLFGPGECPDALLYCGWYSLRKYVDAFTWQRGAVGYHIASFEAQSLKGEDNQQWCRQMLLRGVAATMGPVNEPYTVGFPKPYEFFVTLLTGEFTLVESYFHTLLLNSWMTTLIGDPLYNPFGGRPKLSIEHLRTSPRGAPPVLSVNAND